MNNELVARLRALPEIGHLLHASEDEDGVVLTWFLHGTRLHACWDGDDPATGCSWSWRRDGDRLIGPDEHPWDEAAFIALAYEIWRA